MAQENREVYIAWLREKLEDYCNDDGSYEVYWDYDDSITPDQLVEAVDNWKSEGYTSPESYLASTLYDTVGEAQESQLYVSILDDLNDAPALQKARATDWEIEEQEAAEPVSLKAAVKESRAASEALVAHGASAVDLEHEAEDARKASEAISCTHDDH